MLGADAEKATDLVEVFVGRISFRDRYSVWATSQAAAEKVLTYELENELLNWQLKESPVLKFSDRGVEITTRQAKLETPEEVRAMVGLGNAVLGTYAIKYSQAMSIARVMRVITKPGLVYFQKLRSTR